MKKDLPPQTYFAQIPCVGKVINAKKVVRNLNHVKMDITSRNLVNQNVYHAHKSIIAIGKFKWYYSKVRSHDNSQHDSWWWRTDCGIDECDYYHGGNNYKDEESDDNDE